MPAGYQRNFANGEVIRVVEKSTRVVRSIGVKDNFVASHFLRVIIDGQPNDRAEDEFGRLENVALPVLRTVRPFEPIAENQTTAIKVAMAMLWARSFSHEDVSRAIQEQVVAEQLLTAPTDQRTIELFAREHGRPPNEGEIEAIIELAAETLRQSRVHAVEAMMRHYNKAVEKFLPLHVSLYRPVGSCEFITSDNPVLLARDPRLIQVGAHHGLALGDASFILLPLGRRVAACLTERPEGDLELDRPTTVRLNQAMWRNAVARIACHPSVDNWHELCNVACSR